MGLTRQLKGTGPIDDLSYAYDGNQLRAVNDAADRHIGYIEGATPHTVEYTYDENGNVTSDSNKGISGIKYNYLNLPRHMYAGTTKIDYLYTFSGTKVCKLNINGDTIAHYYAGNFVYEGSSLKYILNEDGMVTTPSTSPVYLYDLKDHLGNTRLEVNSSGTVTQQTDYYPFGMAFKIAGSSDNKYLYNGKELQDDVIGNGTLGWYDYGARMYDAALGRWSVSDPMAENDRSLSLYNYCNNDPIKYIDPDGNWFWEKKEIRQARRFARATGGRFVKHSRKYRKKTGVSATVYLQGTSAGVQVRQEYAQATGNSYGSELSQQESENSQTVDFRTGEDYSYFFTTPDVILANVGAAVVNLIEEVIVATPVGGIFGSNEKINTTAVAQAQVDTYKPAPRGNLPGFPGSARAKPKAGRRRWRLPNGDIAEWDSQHGEVEVYDKTGKKHKGAYDPDTGRRLKPGDKSRNTKK